MEPESCEAEGCVIRIQRSRKKGWRMPEGAIYVGRPSRWGNPWIVGRWNGAKILTLEESLTQYREWAFNFADRAIFEPLRGHDLACWCPIWASCHADILLELTA